MKICPNCKKQYADDVARCLDDGTVLEIPEKVSESETAALPIVEVPRVAESLDRIGTSAAENFDRETVISGMGAPTIADRLSPATASAGTNDFAADDDYTDNPMLGWLLPLIIVIVLIILGYMFCSKAPASHASLIEIQTVETVVKNL